MDWHPGEYTEDLLTLLVDGTTLQLVRCLWQPLGSGALVPLFVLQMGERERAWAAADQWRTRCRRALWDWIAREEDE